jgi:2,4-dienoyl-CoA reductase-like NADH-dependent reductase (Old Yellow Enzyme family)
MYKDECVRWLRELADDVHQNGAAVMIQITRPGRRSGQSRRLAAGGLGLMQIHALRLAKDS